MTFRQLPPDATLQLRVFDGEPEGGLCLSSGQLYPKRLLGAADLHLSHIELLVPVLMPALIRSSDMHRRTGVATQLRYWDSKP